MLLNETKPVDKINARKLSNRSLVKLARRKDSIGRLAKAELASRAAKRPPPVSHSLKALEGALGRRRGINATLADQLKKAHPRSIKIAISRAQKAHEGRLAADRQRRLLKRHEAKLRAEYEAEKQRELTSLRAELKAAANKKKPPVRTAKKASSKVAKAVIQRAPKAKAVRTAAPKTSAPKAAMHVTTPAAPNTPPPQQGIVYTQVPPAVYAPKPAEVPTHIQRERDLAALKAAQARDDARETSLTGFAAKSEKDANLAWDKAMRRKSKKKRRTGWFGRSERGPIRAKRLTSKDPWTVW